MKILITGGAGYIGTELTQRLAQRPEITEIVIYDNLSRNNYNLFLSEKFSGSQITFIHGDILDSRKLKTALNGVQIVFHLAAKVTTPFANQDPHTFEQTNQWGTAELSYLIEESPTVETVVYASSTSVYGAAEAVTTRQAKQEASPAPKTYYGISKMNGEEMISRLGVDEGKKVYVMRCGNVYGYNKSMRFDAVINKFMFEAHFHKKISVQGNGEQYRAFINIQQIGTAFSKLIDSELPSGTYNLVEKNLMVNQVAETVKELYPKIDIIYVQQTLEMKSLRVATDKRLQPYNLFSPTHLKDDLTEFKGKFAF